MRTPSLITLCTDFGLGDPGVAAMKGVILGIAPGATVVDVTTASRPATCVAVRSS